MFARIVNVTLARKSLLTATVCGLLLGSGGAAQAQIDPNAPWRSPQGQAFIQEWINLATARLNSSNLGPDYNPQKPWFINQYGVLNSRNIRSNYAPDLFPRYESRLHWVWAHYNRTGPFGTWGHFFDRANPPIPSVRSYVAGRIASLPRPAAPVNRPQPVAPTTNGVQYVINAAWQRVAGAPGPSNMSGHGEAARSPRGTTGRYQFYRHGYVLWHRNGPYTGRAFATYGDIAVRYAREGGSSGWLGFPISDEFGVTGGRRSNFEGGYILWNASTRQTFVYRW